MKKHNNGISNAQALKNLGAKNIIASTLVSVFFIAMIVVFFFVTYSSVRDSILTRGELDSALTAEQLNRYLISGFDVMKLAEYRVNTMLRDNASNAEILAFMTEQSDTITNARNENFTGIYGYIRGEYLDGAGWVPEDDYVPTERPWYTAAIEMNRQFALVDPYLDAQTGTVMMTLAVMLCDNESVIALDLTLAPIQAIMEESAAKHSGSYSVVIDGTGGVVAHSVKEHLGRNYLQETDTLGALIARRIFMQNELTFTINYHNTLYMVYVTPIENEWYSLSVIDASDIFIPLRAIMISTIVLLIITIGIVVSVLINISKKTLTAERLNTQLSSVSDIYLSMHDIDLVNNTFTCIKIKDPKVEKMIGNSSTNAQETLYTVMDALTAEMSRADVKQFLDLGTLDERLSETDSNTLTVEYLKSNDIWCRARFIVSERSPAGKTTRVLFMVEQIDEEKRRRDKLQYLSETDRMTGVNNRGSGEHKIRELMDKDVGGMFLLLDADKFKHINDTYGHATGDKVLIALAYCLRRAFRSSDIVMRLGGDEFAAFAEGIGDRKLASEKLDRLFSNLRSVRITELEGSPINVSIGVAFYSPNDKCTFDELYKRADTAAYESKKHEGCFVSYYNSLTDSVET